MSGGLIIALFTAACFFALVAWALARIARIDTPPRMPATDCDGCEERGCPIDHRKRHVKGEHDV